MFLIQRLREGLNIGVAKRKSPPPDQGHLNIKIREELNILI
jgi:hypothetical protein